MWVSKTNLICDPDDHFIDVIRVYHTGHQGRVRFCAFDLVVSGSLATPRRSGSRARTTSAGARTVNEPSASGSSIALLLRSCHGTLAKARKQNVRCFLLPYSHAHHRVTLYASHPSCMSILKSGTSTIKSEKRCALNCSGAAHLWRDRSRGAGSVAVQQSSSGLASPIHPPSVKSRSRAQVTSQMLKCVTRGQSPNVQCWTRVSSYVSQVIR